MNKFSNIVFIKIALLFVSIICVCGCSDMNDLHDKYLSQGEKIYVGRPDSAKVFGGKDRLLIRYWVSDVKAKKMYIYWQLRTDSVMIEVPSHLSQLKDSTDFIMDLPEGNYIFDMITMKTDLTGKSVPLQVSGNSYGESYQSTLLEQMLKSSKYISEDDLEIQWYSGISEDQIGNEIVYLNKNDSLVTIFTAKEEMKLIINNFKQELRYRSLFLPEPEAIDTFFTDFKAVEIN